MKLEGKRLIWQDYQKEIADDHYFYARSCIRQTFFPGAEAVFVKILKDNWAKIFTTMLTTLRAQVLATIPM